MAVLVAIVDLDVKTHKLIRQYFDLDQIIVQTATRHMVRVLAKSKSESRSSCNSQSRRTRSINHRHKRIRPMSVTQNFNVTSTEKIPS